MASILDDPISSFDKNKKYAIMEMLFRRDTCLKGRTVLLLTHDVEPIIDTVKVLSRQFNSLTSASFLRCTNGLIGERNITKDDILTFSEICTQVLASSQDEVIKLIYLRRYYEILDEKGDAYELLSNLLHGRSTPIDQRLDNNPPMSQNAISQGKSEVEEKISDFSYQEALVVITDKAQLIAKYKISSNGYEKLQLFRMIDDKHDVTIIRKFINESYHIENEFICQLNPTKFDTVPQFVIDECDKVIAEEELELLSSQDQLVGDTQ